MKKARIMIVEDDEIISCYLEEVLSDMGYDIALITDNGHDAIEQAGKLNPDLILMDIILHGDLDGVEASAAIKKKQETPIIYLTAHADEPTVQRARMTEPHGFLNKPVREGDLLAAVDFALRRAELEKKLRERESLYRELVENSNSIILRMDTAGVVTFMNQYGLSFFGFQEEEVVGRSVVETIVPPVDREGQDLSAMILDIGKNPEKYQNNQNENMCKDGRRMWISWTNRPIYSDTGEIREVLCIGNDITEMKRAEDTVHYSEKVLRSTFNAIPDLLVIIDKTFRVVASNWKGHEYISQDEIHRQPYCYEVFMHRTVPCEECHAYEVFATGKPAVRIAVNPIDGLIREVKCYPIFDEAGNVEMVAEHVRDVTEIKNTEALLKKRSEHLQEKLDYILSPEAETERTELRDILDSEKLQQMMQYFYAATGLPMSILDLHDNILVGVGWQDICMKYHRKHPETAKKCLESDTVLTADLKKGEHVMYKCKNNLWDIATPIFVGNTHAGNLFMGQFFFEDEDVDLNLFRKQAEEYGFDPVDYISCVEKVPRIKRESIENILEFFKVFADILAKLGFSNIRLAKSLMLEEHHRSELAENEQRFRSYIESAPFGVFVCDESGRYTGVNRKACEITGFSEEELLSRSIPEILAPECVGDGLKSFNSLKEDSKTESELFFIRKDGSRYTMRVNAVKIGQNEYVAFCEDTTAQREAEKSLHGATQHLQGLLDYSPSLIAVFDPEGRYILVNAAICSLLNKSRDELEGKSFTDIYTEDVVSLFMSRIKEVMQTHGPLDVDDCLPTPHGERIFKTSLFPLFDLDGSIHAICSIANDVTSERNAEKLLKESEMKFRDLYENAPTAYFTLGTDAVVYDCNRRAWELLGGAREDVCLKNVMDFIPEGNEGKGKARDIIERFKNEETILDEELQIRRVDGIIVWISLSISALKSSAGEIREVRVMAVDFTERRRMRSELENTLKENEALLKEVHHRVKNNFQVITSLLSLQERTLHDNTLVGLFSECRNRIRAMSLVHEKLYQSENFSVLKMRDYLTTIAKDLMYTYTHAPQRITLDIEIEDLVFDVDRAIPCGLVVNELVSNALKYAFTGEPDHKDVLTIRMFETDGSRVELVVADNGKGLPEAVTLSSLEKLDSLGLRLVYRLVVKQLHGEVEISGTEGTCITVRFPYSQKTG
ncbi:MAG TPA: PAS domain S-box protein [Spirochaetota bacterium]|nr:PAS domain S-box protein [Spirochaetota bacterium]